MTFRQLFLPLLLCAPLAACGNSSSQADRIPSGDAIAAKVQAASDKAIAKMSTENISISGNNGGTAEITPAGDLIINGQQRDITAEQRRLLMQYRQQVAAIAQAGAAIGAQGAAVGLSAAREALASAITGNSEDIEAKVKAQTDRIEAEARRLCDLMPPMMATQAALASSMPDFAPYAKIGRASCRERV
mgnify:FL=1